MEEEMPNRHSWKLLDNPFSNITDFTDTVVDHVSGRSIDIAEIIAGTQNAIILSGAPSIGKSTLIRYLQHSPNGWTWRNELVGFNNQQKLKNIQFVQIDLTKLDGIESRSELLAAFVKQCILALQSVDQKLKQQPFDFNLKGLIEVLQCISKESPNARYFLMLDTIERLERLGIQINLDSKAQTPQEYGLELLDTCRAIRTMVDMIDEFPIFGVILSIQSLPRSKSSDRLTHVSADLARFETMTLQSFTWDETGEFLSQRPENFGTNWSISFRALGGNCIFSKEEQTWIREQAGTHPYLLHQFCFHMFDLKQKYAIKYYVWTELQEREKRLFVDRIKERLDSFFAHTWDRLQKALNNVTETKEKTLSDFREFVNLLAQKQNIDEINLAHWDHWGSELRYILCSEGIIRYDSFQPIRCPGSILRQYLVQKARESGDFFIPPLPSFTSGRGFLLTITRPENPVVRLSLSELEYHLLKTLLQNPKLSSELELMIGAWGEKIEKSTFIQRMHHLRKKLREQCDTEIIENRYGGLYSINHPEWFHLD